MRAWSRHATRTDHHEMIVDPAMTDVIDPIVRHHGEPFADSSAIAMYYLARMTKEHVTVALSGDAADEVFAGYKRYRTARLGHVYDALPPVARSIYRGALIGALHFPAPSAARYAMAFPRGEATRYPSLVGHFTPEDKAKLYLPRMQAAAFARHDRALRARAGREHARSAIGRLADLDFQTYLTDDINVKVDIASMAHALEVRCPYLDTEVVEFAARLPASMLMRVRGKYLLRRAAASLVPEPILRRRKRGFGAAAEALAAPRSAQLTHDVLLDRTARERGLFDPAYVAKLVASLDHESIQVDRIWTLLMLELWFRAFIDAPRSTSRVPQVLLNARRGPGERAPRPGSRHAPTRHAGAAASARRSRRPSSGTKRPRSSENARTETRNRQPASTRAMRYTW